MSIVVSAAERVMCSLVVYCQHESFREEIELPSLDCLRKQVQYRLQSCHKFSKSVSHTVCIQAKLFSDKFQFMHIYGFTVNHTMEILHQVNKLRKGDFN